MVPDLKRNERIEFSKAITKINGFRLSQHIVEFPCNLLKVEYRVIIPVCQAPTPSSRPIIKYPESFKVYRDNIRLITVEVVVIEIITSGIITKMSIE